jgi:hypothetical protein
MQWQQSQQHQQMMMMQQQQYYAQMQAGQQGQPGQGQPSANRFDPLANLPKAPSLSLFVFENNITGTVPAAYANFSTVGLAFNPRLYGPLPTGMKLYGGFATNGAWSTVSGSVVYLYGTRCVQRVNPSPWFRCCSGMAARCCSQ